MRDTRGQSHFGADEGRRSSYDESPRLSSRGRLRPAKAPWPKDGPDKVFIAFLCLFAVVLLKLIYVHIIAGPSYASAARQARTNVVALPARRGTIYDRNGHALATSVEAKTVYCNPKEIEDPSAVAELLADDLGGAAKDYLPILSQDTTFAYLYQKADNGRAELLQEHLREQKILGIYFLNDMKRVYPYGRAAAQVLGFVNVDGEGASGLELVYDEILSGENGEMIMELGGNGVPVAGGVHSITEAKDGSDIVISIDIDIQQAAEDALEKGVESYASDSGSVMVTDPDSGEVLAICSTPFLDPADSNSRTDDAMKLRPVTDSYEPGSIFKILTTAIGIENGDFSTDTGIYVPATLQVGDDTVSDDDGRDWDQEMDIREIIRRSSNVGAALMGEKIGAEAFYDGLRSFGIGTPTGIDIPGESEGLITPLSEWGTYTLGAMSFGHAVAMPMDQIVRATGAIANGGLLKTPHLLVMANGEEVDWGEGERVISEKTATAVADILTTVVSEGTGTAAAVPGYKVAGKTGTAEMVDLEHGGYLEGKLMSSMVGFANSEDARVLVYVGLNGTSFHGGDSSAVIFSTIMETALNKLGVPTVEDGAPPRETQTETYDESGEYTGDYSAETGEYTGDYSGDYSGEGYSEGGYDASYDYGGEG